MSAPVDVLAVMDSAKRVAVLCDPLVRSAQHPASNSLEAQAFNLRGEIDEARAAVAELIEAGTAVQAASDAVEAAREEFRPVHVPMDVQSALNRALRSEQERFAAALARVKGGDR